MQSSAAAPGLHQALYRRFGEDARLAEELGFDAVWVGEHRGWYDGFCPAPLHALAYAAGLTERIGLGTAMYLVPQHDARAAARTIATLDELAGGRVELGAGLGYRDPEFDALGLRRDRRGRMMDENLDELEAIWGGERGDEPPLRRQAPRIWMGGMAPAAIARAARRGYGLMLPQTLSVEQVRRIVDDYRAQAARPGPIGMLREAWIGDGGSRYAQRVGLHFTEEAGSWWVMRDRFGFAAGDQLDRQVARGLGAIATGSANEVAAELRELLDAGIEHVAVRSMFEFVDQAALHDQMHRLAVEVAPQLAGAGG
jgi:alkanesulfonate monooxygenase SsuD/methylene tetrahydromethanopterin reductase-like flavin-dependent oxidoreductase (luciferase family)